MFGGYGVFLDGVMFGLIADGDLYLKVDDANREDFVSGRSRPVRLRRQGSTDDDVLPPGSRADRGLADPRTVGPRSP